MVVVVALAAFLSAYWHCREGMQGGMQGDLGVLISLPDRQLMVCLLH